jgi:hypothetical protein
VTLNQAFIAHIKTKTNSKKSNLARQIGAPTISTKEMVAE